MVGCIIRAAMLSGVRAASRQPAAAAAPGHRRGRRAVTADDETRALVHAPGRRIRPKWLPSTGDRPPTNSVETEVLPGSEAEQNGKAPPALSVRQPRPGASEDRPAHLRHPAVDLRRRGPAHRRSDGGRLHHHQVACGYLVATAAMSVFATALIREPLARAGSEPNP
jgi:hypothetical protein